MPFGFGKRKRELTEAASTATVKLLDEAMMTSRRRRGVISKNPVSCEERTGFLAACAATAPLRWQEARAGDPEALRQTARNCLFGTGMPINPRKACQWLAAARIVENWKAKVDPFWEEMEFELTQMLTAREHSRALKDASDWVRGLEPAKRRAER